MFRPTASQLVKENDSYYSLVVGVAKRARQIADKLCENGEMLEEKPVKTAIDEYAAGKFRICDAKEAAEIAKAEAEAKAKAEAEARAKAEEEARQKAAEEAEKARLRAEAEARGEVFEEDTEDADSDDAEDDDDEFDENEDIGADEPAQPEDVQE